MDTFSLEFDYLLRLKEIYQSIIILILRGDEIYMYIYIYI